ncbi:uncharacterized protein BT62DRAFT_166337 [Guyanagaster necrorhizus]|uniref:Uncharacterized protein n=1 Tax=Guyanagaster necrorhizus TaxID=856835 RepID=A0A9P8ARQ1_9AGAR|nr:uncharacterized protein BT62DRAFT_166337 [Guyanagaster necrorhizus MCA 3950]KAG7445608.1 hypothetical protein BT62DRAFT_166337 [Guyanagaster necrorhizus MCA 3950]
MFKSLSSSIPRTPMISSIELPDSTSPLMMRPASRLSSRFTTAFTTSSRSMTPAPNERSRKDSTTLSSSSRMRKTSITGGLKLILKPRKPSPEPVPQRQIAMPRPRKASRTSPVDDIEAAVGARPPVLAYTQSNSSHQGPSGWPATNDDNNVNHPPPTLNKYVFPSKPTDALEAPSGSYRKSRHNEAPPRPQTSMGSRHPKKADKARSGNLTDIEAPLKIPPVQLRTETRASYRANLVEIPFH